MKEQAEFQHYLSETTVFVNGEQVPSDKASISIFDRGFLFGDSIYEVCYGQDGALLFFEDHMERLVNSAQLLKIHFYLSLDEIKDQIFATLRASGLKDAMIRIILTRGESIISLDPNKSFKNNLVTIARPRPHYSDEYYQKGVFLWLGDILRNDKRSVDPNAKSGNYLNNVMALEQAKEMGAYDAIMLNKEGKVTEGTTFNIWIVKNKTIITPPISSGLLAGITRANILKLCQSQLKQVEIKDISIDDLKAADEVFITSSTRKIIPVNKINDIFYGDSIENWPITKGLMLDFDNLVKQQPKEYKYL